VDKKPDKKQMNKNFIYKYKMSYGFFVPPTSAGLDFLGTLAALDDDEIADHEGEFLLSDGVNLDYGTPFSGAYEQLNESHLAGNSGKIVQVWNGVYRLANPSSLTYLYEKAIFALNFSDTTSCVTESGGTVSALTDLSPNAIPIGINTLTYSNGSIGCTDGSYFRIGTAGQTNSLLPEINETFSVIFALKKTDADGNYNIVSNDRDRGGAGTTPFLACSYNHAATRFTFQSTGGGTPGESSWNLSLTQNTMILICFRYNGSTKKISNFYVNGVAAANEADVVQTDNWLRYPLRFHDSSSGADPAATWFYCAYYGSTFTLSELLALQTYLLGVYGI
jgi:hypothetical protein